MYLFISYPRRQQYFKAPNKAFHIRYKLFTWLTLQPRCKFTQNSLGGGGEGRKEMQSQAANVLNHYSKRTLVQLFLQFSFFVPNADHQEGSLRWSHFQLPRAFSESLKGFFQSWEQQHMSRSNKKHTGGQVYCHATFHLVSEHRQVNQLRDPIRPREQTQF